MKKKRFRGIRVGEALIGYGFILPYAIFFGVFMAYALANGIWTSLQHKTFRTSYFCGLDNYIELFSDSTFILSVLNTLGFVIIIVSLTFILSIWISSTIFDKSIRYMSFVRAAYYIPNICSMVVMSVVWACLLNTTSGVVPWLLRKMGFGTVNFLGDPNLAFGTVCVAVVFTNLGTAIVLYLAAMMGVSTEMLEAAEIDGATRFQKIRYILLPSVRGTTDYIFVTNVVAVLKIFAIIRLLTAGGPNYRTTTMMYYLYLNAFNYNEMGVASACGVIMFIVAVIISIPRMKKMIQEM